MGKGKADKKVDAKKVEKVVEDKTFGLKNKNKSKKVQQFVKQVTASARGGKSDEYYKALAAQKKKEKEAAIAAEREMFLLLGKDYAGDLNKKMAKKNEKKKQEEQQQKEKERKDAFDRDFAIPITSLEQVSRIDSKSSVIRICIVLDSKDNLTSKTSKGEECMYIRASDGTTRNPFSITCIGWNPSNFEFKPEQVLDIRDSIAMIRGERVELEVEKGKSIITVASPELTEHILKLKEEQEEIRAQGGLAIEDLIEEQRAKLRLENKALTPITKESFFEWKERKRQRKEKELEEKRKAAEKKSGGKVILSGKQLFTYDPNLFKDDEEAVDDVDYEVVGDLNREGEEEEEEDEDDDNEDGEDNDENDDEEDEDEEEEEEEDLEKKAAAMNIEDTNLYTNDKDEDLEGLDDDDE